MDNLIQKFYSNGKEEEQKYTQFGAFSNSLLKNSSPNLNFKTTTFPKISIGTINPSIHDMETTNKIPKTPNKTINVQNQQTQQEAFLHPKKLIFNGTNDLLNNTIINKNIMNNNDMNNIQNKIPSLNTIKQNMNLESKKNATKMQMMEEKMKNLELKSQRLEVINDFFFDMFENNLVKEELKRQNNKKDNTEKENKDNDEDIDYEEKKKRKKSKKNKKKKLKIDLNDIQAKNQEELEELEFKKKTKALARNYLNTVKNDIGLFLVEEQLKKNEELQNMTEDILDLKGDLLNKLERIQMIQNLEMRKIAYCLQNSGDENVENLANRIFGDNLLKHTMNTNQNSMNNTNALETGSVFNHRASILNTFRKSRRPSVTEIEEKGNFSKRQSIYEKKDSDNINNNKSRRQSFLQNFLDKEKEKNENNELRQKSLFADNKALMLNSIIPEEKNENEN